MSKSKATAFRKTRRKERRSDARNQVDQSPQSDDSEGAPRKIASTKPIQPLNQPQGRYMDAINSSRITFGTGPAGTGKTWVPAAMAADQLREKRIDKIILTRPAVEAGEKLGFLPGDLKEKYAVYLDPFIDALEERLGSGHVEYLLRKKIIEPRPLAFMRGMTFKNAWILVDEAQNISKIQMKMLLTRIGEGSRMIISGDIRQSDLPEGKSGLPDALARCSTIDGFSAVNFTSADIVRDDIVQKIIEAYEN